MCDEFELATNLTRNLRVILLLTFLFSALTLILAVSPANGAHSNFITIVGDPNPIPNSSFSYSGEFSTSPQEPFVAVRVNWGEGSSETLSGFSVFYDPNTGHGRWGTFHLYTTEGPRTITVSLLIPDPDGAAVISTDSLDVNVQSVPESTTISLSDRVITVGTSISASGTFRTGLGSQCVIVDWGDDEETIVVDSSTGSYVDYDSNTNSGVWGGVTHTYDDTGSFQVSAIQGGIEIDSQECISKGTAGTDTINVIVEQLTAALEESRIVWEGPVTVFGTIVSSSPEGPCVVIDWNDGSPSTTIAGDDIEIDFGTMAGEWIATPHSFSEPGLFGISVMQGQMMFVADICQTRGAPVDLIVEVERHRSAISLEPIDNASLGQTVVISGRLLDEDMNSRIPNAEIVFSGSGVQSFETRQVFTDNLGEFTLQGPAPQNIGEQLDVIAYFQETTLYLESQDSEIFGILETNRPPIANAGPDRIVDAGSRITLDGTGSSDPDTGTNLDYTWTQTAGPSVRLSGASTATPTFQSPAVEEDTTITFSLTVNDGQLDSIRPDRVSITLNVQESLTMEISKEPMESVDRIVITGLVGQAASGTSRTADLLLTRPDGSIVFPSISVPISNDGTYVYSQDFSSSDNGSWSATISYGGLQETRRFDVSVSVFQPYLIAFAIVPVAVAAYVVYKKWPDWFPGPDNTPVEPPDTPPIPVWYLNVGVEIEDAVRQDNENFSQQIAVTDESQSIARSLEDTLSRSALQVKESLKSIRETAEVTTLCIEGQRNPDELLTEVANRGFKEMLAYFAPIYSRFFLEDITIASEIQILQRDKEGKRRAATEIDISMRPLKPFIEVGFAVNGLPTKNLFGK